MIKSSLCDFSVTSGSNANCVYFFHVNVAFQCQPTDAYANQVRVALRIRPFTKQERENRPQETDPSNSVFSFVDTNGCTVVAKVPELNQTSKNSRDRERSFTFDAVFNETIGQRGVYRGTVSEPSDENT